MNRRLVFMKARLHKDLEDLEDETSQHQHLIQRRLIGVEVGNQFAFISFQLLISCGPFEGCRLNISLKIGSDYPYSPPQVYCHDKGFFHPNKDISSNQIMFSMVDPKFWKPTFELSQVLCGIEMILLSPEPSYSSLRANEIYNAALHEGMFQKALAGNMELEGDHFLHQSQTSKCLTTALLMARRSENSFEKPIHHQVKVKTLF